LYDRLYMRVPRVAHEYSIRRDECLEHVEVDNDDFATGEDGRQVAHGSVKETQVARMKLEHAGQFRAGESDFGGLMGSIGAHFEELEGFALLLQVGQQVRHVEQVWLCSGAARGGGRRAGGSVRRGGGRRGRGRGRR